VKNDGEEATYPRRYRYDDIAASIEFFYRETWSSVSKSPGGKPSGFTSEGSFMKAHLDEGLRDHYRTRCYFQLKTLSNHVYRDWESRHQKYCFSLAMILDVINTMEEVDIRVSYSTFGVYRRMFSGFDQSSKTYMYGTA
jgi:hypothetical protein